MACGIWSVHKDGSAERVVDFASVQALFGMQDDKMLGSLRVPLTPEQLAWWQERMRKTIALVRQTFPRARVVYRKLHRTDDTSPGTRYITNCKLL